MTRKTPQNPIRLRTDGLPYGTPRPVDLHVGARLRLRRTLLGITQDRLAKAVGLTFQQIQKYERGANRIGASRLYEFSRILDVPVSFFFDCMADNPASGTPPESTAPDIDSFIGDRQWLELAKHWPFLDGHHQTAVLNVAKVLAQGNAAAEPNPPLGQDHDQSAA